jgi:hypothetical protein
VRVPANLTSKDACIFYATAFVRSAAAGLTGVAAAIALRERGLTAGQSGSLHGASVW